MNYSPEYYPKNNEVIMLPINYYKLINNYDRWELKRADKEPKSSSRFSNVSQLFAKTLLAKTCNSTPSELFILNQCAFRQLATRLPFRLAHEIWNWIQQVNGQVNQTEEESITKSPMLVLTDKEIEDAIFQGIQERKDQLKRPQNYFFIAY